VEALDAGRSGLPLRVHASRDPTEALDPDVEQPELSEEEQQAQMLAQLQMQAHEQGYNAGLNEGRQKGHELGYQEGLAKGLEHGIDQARQQQAPIHARMQQLVSEFQHTLDALDSVIASRLMQMALEAARQVIGQTPVVDNTALIKQIQGLLQQEPLFSGKPQLRVHPDDLQRVEEPGRRKPARLASARRSVVTSRRLQSLCR
jgi:flagellar assembly protein FliH